MTHPSRVLHLIAHNIRSAENVGSLFRTCDSLGVTKLWITGYSPTPEHPRVEKTALGAERTVDWEQRTDVESVINELKDRHFRIVGLELDRRSVDLLSYEAPRDVALLLGNEVEGITPSLLDLCDDVVSIVQHGKKESLNVGVAAAIASFWILNRK
ncbi:MAG: RNA methyltransferase [Patescibacteria group bacterium]